MKGKTFIRKHWLLLVILCVAAAVRLTGLGKIPGGVLPDEAYGAYNAWALMTEGIDSRGYSFPVYFVAWGSGMSVLYSYLAIPLFKLFGATVTVYRIPQAVIGILGVYAAYVLGRELLEERFGLLFAFVLAINPWNIMNTRYGLDANMAPDMFLIAVTLLVLAMRRKPSYFLPAAFAMGLTLYCYALSWIMIPVFLLLFLILHRKSIPFGKHLWIGVVILFLMACPLMYFVGVNIGLLPEVRTAFFSIPRLPGFRGEELDVTNILYSARDLCKLILTQYDGVDYTACRETGAYYYFTTPLLVTGILWQLVSLIRSQRSEKRSLEYVMLLWLISAGIMSVLNASITMIHVNLLHIPMIFYGAYAIWQLSERLRCKIILQVCVGFFVISFGFFGYYYTTESSNRFWDERGQQALQAAKEKDDTVTIVIPTTINYGNILWNDKIPVREFLDTVVYSGDAAWATASSFAGYRYLDSFDDVTEDGTYLILSGYGDEMADKGYEIIPVNAQYSLAVRGEAQ